MFYTGKGDRGTTQLYRSAVRQKKSGPVLEALGMLDELNTYIGVCRAVLNQQTKAVRLPNGVPIANALHEVQETLFSIQAQIAGAEKQVIQVKIKKLEETIQSIEDSVPPITHFTIPGSTYASALLDHARALTRTAERRVVVLKENEGEVQETTFAYLNRLSSLFFALARYVEFTKGVSYEAPSYE